ncbi:MAG: hypothetical protein AAF371_16995, partial [Pseudomonadota bacterium]
MTFLARSTPTVLTSSMDGSFVGTTTPQHGATRRREQEPSTPSIENAFSKLKALLRKAAERTVDGLWSATGRIVDLFTPTECRKYFAACGYDPD